MVFDSQGNLYGTTGSGGVANLGQTYDVAFRLSPPPTGSGPWTYVVLYSFTGGQDGAQPDSLIFDAQKKNL
jgi:hypothetical protein